ncbi:9239_t:CDS:2, partial [Cetraspora pellucida]
MEDIFILHKPTNEFFYLDVSESFTITDNTLIPWVDLTYTKAPSKVQATACNGGKNNDIIFIFGGSVYNQSFFNQFDTSKQQWSDIISVGNVPTDRYLISCANFNNGMTTIFSGVNRINDLWIFNSLSLTWNLSNATNAPPSREGYSAITLPNNNILYIGGKNSYNPFKYMPMNILPLYNTKSDTWEILSISDPTPPARSYFSAVLTPDGRIIIFGGDNGTTFGDLWILDIVTFQWSIGNILNPIADLTLSDHTATLVNNYMFVAFGRFSNLSYSSRIFMLNVNQKDSYNWVTEFTSNLTISNNTIPSDTNFIAIGSKNINLIIGVIIGGEAK